MHAFLQDARHAIRFLTSHPGFAFVAILTLALGIGANSAIFCVVHAMLLKPLPFHDPERLCVVWEDATHHGFPRDTPAPANFFDWKRQSRSFSGMAAYSTGTLNLTGVEDPEQLASAEVSADFFDILGAPPWRGRGFAAGEDRDGAAPVAILSHGLWRRRFGADPAVVGRSLTLNGKQVTVVGVMPAAFRFPEPQTDVWVPFTWTAQEQNNRDDHYLVVVGRLKAAVDPDSADAEMKTIARRLEQAYPASNKHLGAVIVSLREHISGDVRPALLALWAAVGFVLLIACANVANLLLARGTSRQREIAVRAALGASRPGLLRLLMTESLILALAGAGCGLFAAAWGIGALQSLASEELAFAGTLHLSFPVLLFTLGLATCTALLFGAVPAWQATRIDPGPSLKEGGRGLSSGRSPLKGALVAAEVGLSLCLLVGAGLMTRTFLHLLDTPLGFRPDHALTMRTVLSGDRWRERTARNAFYQDVLDRIRVLPGVKSAGFTSHLPLTSQGDNNSFLPEGEPIPPPGQEHIVSTRIVTDDYFRAMGMRLVAGRPFNERDTTGSEPVVVINERLARQFWPAGAIGKRLHRGEPGPQLQWLRIVGVVSDVRQWAIDLDPRVEMYLPVSQFPGPYFRPRDLVIRTAGDPAALASAARAAIRSVDKDQPISAVRTLEDLVGSTLARRRLQFVLFGSFAAIALLLASVGVYAVLSHLVGQRTRELGVRIALGARTGDVMRLVLGRAMTWVLGGIVAGLLAALGLTRFVASLLYGVEANDPLTFAAVTLLLILAALAACYLPARRATRVDPTVALREE